MRNPLKRSFALIAITAVLTFSSVSSAGFSFGNGDLESILAFSGAYDPMWYMGLLRR